MVEQLNTIARLWWDWSAAMFWQVGLLILLIAAIDRLIRRWAWPQLRYALWSLILIKLLLPPSLSLPSGILPGLEPVVRQVLARLESEKPAAVESRVLFSLNEDMLRIPTMEPGMTTPFAGSGGIAKAEGLVGVPNGDRGMGLGSPTQNVALGVPFQPMNHRQDADATGNRGRDARDTNHRQASLDDATQTGLSVVAWQVYAMMASLAGTLILGIGLFLRLHSFVGRNAQIAAAASLPQSFYNQLAGCAKRLELRCIPRVVVTKRLATPAVFGVFRPVLLMPKGYLSKLSRRDTEHMLLHELAHIKRGDLIAHSLYMLLQIVYWYNPLLWLVRRQMHHLRELSCDATVAELLREQTTAYRQTLLETARRLLTSSVEPGLGLLGLFEDSNRLLVRLNWLTKPTWRYRTMKRVTVATIAALMLACVLPMARAQEAVSNEQSSEAVKQDNQASQEIAALQAQLEQLMAQQKELQKQLLTLAAKRGQTLAKEEPAKSPKRVVAAKQPPRAPAPGDVGAVAVSPAPPVAPMYPAPPTGKRNVPAGAQEQAMKADAQEQAMKAAALAQEAAKAATDVHKAKMATEVQKAKAQQHRDWAKQMEAWAAQLHEWEQSEEMQAWQKDMEKWGQQMEIWAQELGRRHGGSADSSEVPEMAPMPAMPAMPAMPVMPVMPPASAAQNMDVNVQVDVQPKPLPHPVPRIAPPKIHVPHIEPPRIEMPKIDPPVPPAIPEREEGQEEAVSRTEHEIDLPQGRLLAVKNEMGSITVRGSHKSGCKLVVTIKGGADTMEEAQAIVDQTKLIIRPLQEGVSVTTTKPENESDREHVNRAVTMEIVVPHDARLRLSQAFGDIRLNDLDGTVQAVSNMGSIRAVGTTGQIALESNFGAIDFFVPDGFSANVQAKADFGSIQSDLPLAFVKSDGPSMGSKASGTIGGGEGNISLKTNMGSIRIRSQDAKSAQEF